jgi:hypothetical protein
LEKLEKVQAALHTEGYMTGLAMRIIEERELHKDNGSENSLNFGKVDAFLLLLMERGTTCPFCLK